MKKINCTLYRSYQSPEGTFGMFTAPELDFLALAIELPPRENQRGLSCIPYGVYSADWDWSNKLQKYAFRLQNVPDRTGILIHSGSFAGDVTRGYRADLLGCISLGASLDILSTGSQSHQRAITRSKQTVADFERRANTRSLSIVIYDPVPESELLRLTI